MQTDVMRQKLFNIRFSDEEWARLEALCTHLGVNAANLVRMLLKEKARDLGLEPSAIAEALTVREGAARADHKPPKSLMAARMAKTVKKKTAK